ncbi:MAG: c-type cytochrome [Rhodospirillales bacterium]|nr:c-type cytochrome [Rhodospirillales bacterium]
MALRRASIYAAAVVAAAAGGIPGVRGQDGLVGDADRGEAVFASKCAVCHSTRAGWNKEGPSLAGVFGRRAGTAADFTGYRALRGLDVVWSEASLDAWLADPKGFTGRNSAMPAKLGDPRDRTDVIAYLRRLR